MKIAVGRTRIDRQQGARAMSATESNSVNNTLADADLDQELVQIREALRGLRFGALNIIVQDGVVVQIDRTEKHRVRRAEGK